jgi:hypothetical protein
VVGAACVPKDNPNTVRATPGTQCAEPGATARCYTGPAGTQSVGICADGVTICSWELVWSDCEGQVAPLDQDDCSNGLDDDCDATVDEGADLDGDGWGECEGDCCDNTSCAADPKKVNPGAFEADANLLDDDCDGVADNPDPGCMAGDPTDSFSYARALDLCRTTTEDATGLDQRWGVISVTLTRANGTPLPNTTQHAIANDFGVNLPRFGDTFVVLSTGAAVDQADPSWVSWQTGTDMQPTGNDGSVPGSWLAANNGDFPSAPGCPKPGGSDVNDPVMLTLQLRVPTNASSFNLSSFFFSSEYPEYVCSAFNDFFIMLLSSEFDGEPANPRDGNLAFYTAPNGDQFPVGVNLAQGTGLFTQCQNGTMGCQGQNTSLSTACVSQADLVGTGFDETGGACVDTNIVGGGTGWLNTTGNVVPGEIITLRIAIWDTGDALFDSLALIDNFQWNIEPTVPGTGQPPPL